MSRQTTTPLAGMAKLSPAPVPRTSGLRRAWQALGDWRHWPRETRDTLFQLAVIGWAVLPHAAHLAWWCGALTAAVLVWRAGLALSGGALPGRWQVMAVLGLALGLTWITEHGLLGRESGVTMLVVLLGLKTLELRARRDAMVVFFLGFFLVLTDCLYSQSLLTALAMLVAAWGLLTALVLANMPVGKPPLKRAAAVAARSALLGLPLMAALFVLFPRIGPLWGLPQDSVGRTGLSGTLRLGGVASLANDEAIALRVRFNGGKGEQPPAEALYFRGPVLSRFDGLEWQQSFRSVSRPTGPGVDLQLQGEPLRYEMLVEPIRLPLLPLLEATPDLAGSAPLLPDWQPWQGSDLLWHTERLVTERLRLQAQAWPRYTLGLHLDTAERRALTALPEGFNPRTLAWARGVRRQLADADARTLAVAVMAHIRQNPYVYTLQPGTYGRDAVDEFWFDRREGFCEHYAAAFVIVMRAMAVPARLVTGYQGAEPPDADGFRIVRQSHAHAWAEFWQADAGWLRADPTAAVAPERVRSSQALPVAQSLVGGALRTMSPALFDQLRRGWELLDSRWTQWVMGYSRSSQFSLLEQLGVPNPDWTQLVQALVGLLSLAGLAGAAWAWHDRRRQDPWQRLYRRVGEALARCGVPAAPHSPPRTLAAAVRARHGAAGEALAATLDALDRHRYAPGGRRMPPRGWWDALAREAASLATR